MLITNIRIFSQFINRIARRQQHLTIQRVSIFKEYTTKPMDEYTLLKQYKSIRKRSLSICDPLETEDYVLQPIVDVSPPKWHLGHTTWFFETFILIPHFFNYQPFDSNYNYIFNSYYETIGARVIRTDRGNLSRPTVSDVKAYRAYVDEAMDHFLREQPLENDIAAVFILGLNHEQQHQELLLTDIKYILGNNPLFPPYEQNSIYEQNLSSNLANEQNEDVQIAEGIYEIGYTGDGFCFDNELGRHKVYVEEYTVSGSLVTNNDYLEFIDFGGYEKFQYWHAEAWDWLKTNSIHAPMYWYKINGEWHRYTLAGLKPVRLEEPVCHINYYEATAFAMWKGTRLPTEPEWEIASDKFSWGKLWEWTESAYLPYPRFEKAAGAIGEYNGKFMVNQMVLRGASIATSLGHSRASYRNFFHAHLHWQFTGIRLIK